MLMFLAHYFPFNCFWVVWKYFTFLFSLSPRKQSNGRDVLNTVSTLGQGHRRSLTTGQSLLWFIQRLRVEKVLCTNLCSFVETSTWNSQTLKIEMLKSKTIIMWTCLKCLLKNKSSDKKLFKNINTCPYKWRLQSHLRYSGDKRKTLIMNGTEGG